MEFQVSSRRKAGKEILESSRLKFSEKFSVYNFALSDAQDSTSEASNRKSMGGLVLLRALLIFFTFLGSDRLFCFITMSKFSSFENPFATVTSLSKLHFRCQRFILLVQT